MKMKILSPAGDLESLKVAVYNGADEVYLGVKDFNARNIEGFSLDTLKQAVDFAHVFDVKVNLTVNILFSDDEIQSALDLIVDAYNLGVDSFIIQDIGLASLVHVNYPKIEMHASTQMGIHNLEGVIQAEKLGFKRVVLARETPLEEIKRIKENSNVEIEYFCQGALCVSFSGNCYLSSYLNDASGNRGKCKQLCRLPYSLRYNNKEIRNGYLLSAKDFNMLDRLDDLQEAGVSVLKIEGRARRPFYVGATTRIYKRALNKEPFDIKDLELAFNRGYTAGYFDGNGDIISNKQNHIGIKIGEVKDFKKGKRFNEIFIKSEMEISPKSVLKFIKNNEEVVITAFDISKQKNLVRITTTQVVPIGADVNLISDYIKEQEMLNFKSRRKIQIKITAKIGKPIEAEFEIGNEAYKVFGSVCEHAMKQPISEKDFILNFNKSELFEANLSFDVDNVFLPKQKVNEFRRSVFEKIFNLLTENKKEKYEKIIIKSLKKCKKIKKFNNFQEIFNFDEQFLCENIIYNPEEYSFENIIKFIKKCKKENKKGYLSIPNFALEKDVDILRDIVEKTKIPFVVNNLFALGFEGEKIAGGGLNVFNTFSANYLGCDFIVAEGGDYKMQYMTLIHCPMKAHMKSTCSNCCYKNGYEYVMQNGKRLKLKRKKMSTCIFYLTE